MFKFFTLLFSALVLTLSCSTASKKSSTVEDKYLWLEEVESPRSQEFAKTESDKTLRALQNDPHFKYNEKELRKMAYAKDRIPWSAPRNGFFYNFWRDEKNARGLWRRTTLSEYKKDKPKWDIIIDLDKLAAKEQENWVWHGSSCLPPEYTSCLIMLSRGGKDASVVREFDMAKKEFVKDGFFIPEAKTSFDWIDHNTLFVGTDTGPDSLTDSGYPRTLRYLTRGQKISDAPVIFEVDKKDQSVSAYIERVDKTNFIFLTRSFSFYQKENYYFENGVRILLPLPRDADFYGYFKGYVLFALKSDLKTPSKIYKTGSLVALPLDKIKDKTLSSMELIFEPTDKKFLSTIATTKNFLLLDVMDNIQGKIVKVSYEKPHSWTLEDLELGNNGVASVDNVENENDTITVSYADFVTPTSTFMADVSASKVKFTKIKTSPERFNKKDIVSFQKFAKSADGTMIPYYIIHNKNIKLNGKNPTLLYGYGGFEYSQQPFYMSGTGKLWLEKGGVFVLSNIRGGGEFGPAWHKAAVLENHQVVFDDFIAIAEKLIADKVTSPPPFRNSRRL